MKLINASGAVIRLEGVGTLRPGESIDVLDGTEARMIARSGGRLKAVKESEKTKPAAATRRKRG
jgi:hypothetical protein